MPTSKDIFIRPVPQNSPGIRLFCVAHAGGGASTFARWAFEADAAIEVLGMQPPGRETRLKESPVRRIELLVDEFANGIEELPDSPFALFGHSMGALVVYEVARELRRRGAAPPRALLLSGFRAPGAASPMTKYLALPDEEFVARVGERYGAIPAVILADKGLLDLYLPALRADFELLSAYRHVEEAPLQCPFFLYNGQSDALIEPSALDGWRMKTTEACSRRWFPGAHFYLRDQRAAVLRALAEDLLP